MPEVNTKTISIERLKRFLDDLPATSPLSKQAVAGELWRTPIPTTSATITSTSKIVQRGNYLYTIINGALWCASVSDITTWTLKDDTVTYNNLAVFTSGTTTKLILCTTSGIKYIDGSSIHYPPDIGGSIYDSNITTGNFIMEPVLMRYSSTSSRMFIGSADSKTSATNSILYSSNLGSTWTVADSTCSVYFDGNGIQYSYRDDYWRDYVLLGGTKIAASGTGDDGFVASRSSIVQGQDIPVGETWYTSSDTTGGSKYFCVYQLTADSSRRIFCTGTNGGVYYFTPDKLSFETSPTNTVSILQKNYPDNIGASTQTSSGYYKPPKVIERYDGSSIIRRLILVGANDNTGIFYSDDNGASFSLATGTSNSTWCVPIIVPEIWTASDKILVAITVPYSGTDGNIIYSNDFGTTWYNAFNSDNCVALTLNEACVTPFVYLENTDRMLVSTQKGILYSDSNGTVPDFSDKSDDGKFVTRDFLKDTISDLLTYLNNN